MKQYLLDLAVYYADIDPELSDRYYKIALEKREGSATDEYKEFVVSRKKDGQAILDTLTPEKCDLLHMAILISGEAGELLDAVKKHVIYNTPLDIVNVQEELGDILFGLFGMIDNLDLDFHHVLEYNKEKLSIRYKDGYSDKEAQQRKDKED